MNESKLDRRPIAARNLPISGRVTDVLAKWGMSPNAISVWSMVFGLASGLSFWATSFDPPAIRVFWILAAFFILMRLLANMFDGMVAVKTGTSSPVGELYNEVPEVIWPLISHSRRIVFQEDCNLDFGNDNGNIIESLEKKTSFSNDDWPNMAGFDFSICEICE